MFNNHLVQDWATQTSAWFLSGTASQAMGFSHEELCCMGFRITGLLSRDLQPVTSALYLSFNCPIG
jgi:hypothetical protein